MQNRRWNTIALLSLCCTMASLIFWPAIVPAIVLVVFAVRGARKNSNDRGVKLAFWAITPLLLLIFVTAVATVGLTGPRMVAAAKARHEVGALNAIREVRTALAAHRNRFGGYPASLQVLVEQGLLESHQTQGSVRSYYFSYDHGKEIRAGSGLYDSFAVFARPGRFSFGQRLFYLNTTGVIQIQKSDQAGDEIEQELPPPPDWGNPRPIG